MLSPKLLSATATKTYPLPFKLTSYAVAEKDAQILKRRQNSNIIRGAIKTIYVICSTIEFGNSNLKEDIYDTELNV